MKYPHYTQALILAVGLFMGNIARAGDVTDCDKVLASVKSAIQADPTKVLVIVEDAMVANESCACEIVKAAVLASQASNDLAKQIVLTATNVAPNMSAVIADCAAATSATAGVSSKSAKEVLPMAPVAAPESADYIKAPADIRGVYLIQPAAGGVVITTNEKEHDDEKPVEKEKTVTRTEPTSTPQSPSVAKPN